MTKVKTILAVFAGAFLMASCSSDDPIEVADNPAPGEENNGDEIKDDDNSSKWILTSEVELTSEDKETMAGVNEFSYMIMKEAATLSDDGAFCISPVSASIYLGMMANASTGNLRNEILQSFNAEDMGNLNALFEKLMHYLPCEDYGSALSINNRFWVDEAVKVPEDFSSAMASVFNADIDYVRFTEENAVSSINDWASLSTDGKIPMILDGDWRNYSDLQMFSANTVYFKGDWEWKFSKKESSQETFHTPTGDKTVNMMHRFALGTYAANEKVQSMTLSFEGSQNLMEIYLPAEGVSVRELAEALTPAMQQDLISNRRIRNIDLSFPSFRSEMSVDMPVILDNIAIPSIANADLSPMGLGKMPVNSYQKASIKVDEVGAELAAATTGWGGHAYPVEDDVVILNFNRPFVYMIRNVLTGAILMSGAITDPD